jgi:hypothetical protein
MYAWRNTHSVFRADALGILFDECADERKLIFTTVSDENGPA